MEGAMEHCKFWPALEVTFIEQGKMDVSLLLLPWVIIYASSNILQFFIFLTNLKDYRHN